MELKQMVNPARGVALAAMLALGCTDSGPTGLEQAHQVSTTAARAVRAVEITGISVASGGSYDVRQSLAAGSSRYVDRAYTFTGVPSAVAGATYLRTANNDKTAQPGSTSFLSFDVKEEVVVYVAHDDRAPRPLWLATWTNTTMQLTDNDAAGAKFTMFSRTFPAGRVTLGSNVSAAVGDVSMYSVVVIPAPTTTTTPTTPTTPTEVLPALPLAITAVTVTSGRAYAVVNNGLTAGVLRYTDRGFTVKTVPAALEKTTFIRTANSDKSASPGSSTFLTFTVNQAVEVYVAHDDRAARPTWLSTTTGWTDTGTDLSDSDGDNRGSSIFRKSYPAGVVTLGSNVRTSSDAVSMYTVMVVPATQPTTTPTDTVNTPTTDTVPTVPPTTPPPTSGATIALNLTRLDGGSGTVLVSSGVPLAPGMLMPGDVNRVRLLVNNVEQPVYVQALSGRHRDGSVRSLLVQASYSVGATPVAAQLAFGATRTTTDRAKVAPAYTYAAPLPAAIFSPTSPAYLISTGIVGPTVTSSEVYSASYESRFVQHSDLKWSVMKAEYGTTLTGDAALVRNYYDRALSHWGWWVRTGDVKYYHRAIYYLMGYRERFLRPNNYAIQPHDSQIEGLELHYLLTGDEESLRGVSAIADRYGTIWMSEIGDVNHAYMDNRIQSRMLLALITAQRLGITARDYTGLSRQAMNLILGTQRADGSYLWPASCGGQLNFMAGLLNEVLAKYYDTIEADARVLAAVRKSIDWMWTTQWLDTQGAFKYVSLQCPAEGGMEPAPDVNMLIGHAFGWVYSRTGDANYRTRGDRIFNEGVARAWLGTTGTQQDKQFNQSYRSSFQYLFYRK